MNPAAPVTSARGLSVGMLLSEPAEKRQDEDLQVEQQRPVLHVIEVVLDALLERRVAAPAVDLGPAGHAAAHAVTQHVTWDALLELLHEGRALGARADEAHVALHDVQELRQLVE